MQSARGGAITTQPNENKAIVERSRRWRRPAATNILPAALPNCERCRSEDARRTQPVFASASLQR